MPGARTTAVLLISCRDQQGLVASVSDFLYRHGGNIVHADQHTDQEEGVFLQRVEWELDGFALARDAIAPAFQPVGERFAMDWRLHFSDAVPSVALLVSKLPHCLYDLLARWRMGEFEADVSCVISNHADARPIANGFGVPFHHLPIAEGGKAAQEAELLKVLDTSSIDLVVMARYMQILSEGAIARYPQSIINIHQSFLPAFAGANAYQQARERGVKLIGATAHYATAAQGDGPIIEQDVVRSSHRDGVADLERKGRDLERQVLARAVRWHLQDRVLLHGQSTVVFG